MASDVVLIDTPGTNSVNLERFEYEHIPRPIYLLDPDESIMYPA